MLHYTVQYNSISCVGPTFVLSCKTMTAAKNTCAIIILSSQLLKTWFFFVSLLPSCGYFTVALAYLHTSWLIKVR